MTSATCSICAAIPEPCWEEYASDTLISAPFPPAVGKLVVVPTRRKELLQCPECGAFYLREYDHFNVANGPEERSIDIKRITTEEANALRAQQP